MMKIALYSPYLDTAGGGEKYILTAAEILSSKHDVTVLLDDHLISLGINNLKSKIEKLHQIDFSKIDFKKAPLGKGSLIAERLIFLTNFDMLIYLTDGSIFYSTAKKNIIHFQVPIPLTQASIWSRIKLSSWDLAIYNSFFTKKHIEESWPIKGEVIYPPVSTNLFKTQKKKNQIISVGRFFGYLKNKKHELLIKTFKDLVKEKKLNEWSLHLVGAAGDGDKEYIKKLRKEAQKFKIFIYPNLAFDDLKILYGESRIYWHAMGFREDDPTKMEHFGVTVVEAMAAGCVPVVINKGGLTEIVEDGKSGFLWNDVEDFKSLTMRLIEDEKLTNRIKLKAIKRAQIFNKNIFAKKILELVEK